MPLDQPVLLADRMANAKNARYLRLRQWSKLDCALKFLLAFSTVLMSGCILVMDRSIECLNSRSETCICETR